MKVTVHCPAGHRFQTEEIHLGKTVRCPEPSCGKEFVLQAEGYAAGAESPAAPPTSPSTEDETVWLPYGRPGQATAIVPFSVGASFQQGWEVLKGNYWLLFGGWAIAALLPLGVGLIPIVGPLANLVIGPVLTAGMYFMGVIAFRGYQLGIENVFDGFKRFFAIWGITLLMMVIWIPCMIPAGLGAGAAIALDSSFGSPSAWVPLVAGAVISVALVVMVLVRLMFATQICLETGLGVMDSLHRSWAITDRLFLPLLGLVVLLGIGACLSMVLLILPYVFFWGPFMIGVLGSAYGLAADQTARTELQ